MKEHVIDTTIEKAITITRLCQRVKEEVDAMNKNLEIKSYIK